MLKSLLKQDILKIAVGGVIFFILFKIVISRADRIIRPAVKYTGLTNLSYSAGIYKAMADRLHEAMKGLGTNKTVCLEVFNQLKTCDDVKALYNAFGKRKGEDLVAWIKGEVLLTMSVTINNKLKCLYE